MIFCYVYHWLSLYHCVSHTWKDVIQIGIQTPGRILLTSGCDAGRSSSSNTSTYTYTCGDHSSLKLREQSGCAVSEDVFNRKRFGEEVIWLLDWWMNWFDLGIDGFFELISVEFSMYQIHDTSCFVDWFTCFFACFILIALFCPAHQYSASALASTSALGSSNSRCSS